MSLNIKGIQPQVTISKHEETHSQAVSSLSASACRPNAVPLVLLQPLGLLSHSVPELSWRLTEVSLLVVLLMETLHKPRMPGLFSALNGEIVSKLDIAATRHFKT